MVCVCVCVVRLCVVCACNVSVVCVVCCVVWWENFALSVRVCETEIVNESPPPTRAQHRCVRVRVGTRVACVSQWTCVCVFVGQYVCEDVF